MGCNGFDDIIQAAEALERSIRALAPGDLSQAQADALSTLLTRSVGALQCPRSPRADEAKSDTAARRETWGIVGQAPTLLRVLELVDKVGPSQASVLITGENGTGKEGIARALHAASRRAGKALLVQNCGALSETLLESELFGHVKGAFTGAVADKKGLFEASDGGTLFLDEIGETSPAMQVRLLRVLQEGTFYPLGGAKERKVDVRIIAATNRDLNALVREGRFRQDLYYRLNVVHLELPPLRARGDDVTHLTLHFLRRYAAAHGLFKQPAPALLEKLGAYSWPGNIRQLENEIMRLCIFSGHEAVIETHWLSVEVAEGSADSRQRGPRLESLDGERGLALDRSLAELTEEFQRAVVAAVLAHHGGKIGPTARSLMLTYEGMKKLIKRLRVPRLDEGNDGPHASERARSLSRVS